jgi:Clp amino terminal domain, pathogenicity island component
MFERFTDRARRVLVLAQEEARVLHHGFIGTEHILLGLIDEGEGLAARALESLGISLDAARELVEETVGHGRSAPTGSPPFTPRAKKVLELSLREALQLGHNYIGTEHMLLGLVREGEGVAAQVLQSLGAGLPEVREAVISLLAGSSEPLANPMVSVSGPIRLQSLRNPFGWHRFAARVIPGPDKTLVDEEVKFRVTGILLDEARGAESTEVLWLIAGMPAPLFEALGSGASPISPPPTRSQRDHSILKLSDDTKASYRALFEVTSVREKGEIAGCSVFVRKAADQGKLDAAKTLNLEWRGQTISTELT